MESTKIHGPADQAPNVTNLVAHCRVCKVQWQVLSHDDADTLGCHFCNAGPDAVYTVNEDEET